MTYYPHRNIAQRNACFVNAYHPEMRLYGIAYQVAREDAGAKLGADIFGNMIGAIARKAV